MSELNPEVVGDFGGDVLVRWSSKDTKYPVFTVEKKERFQIVAQDGAEEPEPEAEEQEPEPESEEKSDDPVAGLKEPSSTVSADYGNDVMVVIGPAKWYWSVLNGGEEIAYGTTDSFRESAEAGVNAKERIRG